MTLADTPVGSFVRVRALRYHRPEISRRLREMGFCEDAVVRCVLRGNGNLICEVQNTRIGMDNRLAGAIEVGPTEDVSR